MPALPDSLLLRFYSKGEKAKELGNLKCCELTFSCTLLALNAHANLLASDDTSFLLFCSYASRSSDVTINSQLKNLNLGLRSTQNPNLFAKLTDKHIHCNLN
jgi:hypothetical protein